MFAIVMMAGVGPLGCGAPERSLARPTPEAPKPLPAPALPAVPTPGPASPRLPPVIRIPLDVERAVDDSVRKAIADRKTPGAVVVVGRRDGVVFRRAYGNRARLPSARAMTVDTVFDLASLTKALVTAPAIAWLVSNGQLSYDDPVGKYVPAFREGAKGGVTIRDLLLHMGGMPGIVPLRSFDGGTRAEVLARVLGVPLASPPRTRFDYSDMGYMALGEVVAKVSGEPLDAFAHTHFFAPLAMTETTFRPLDNGIAADRIAPTETTDKRVPGSNILIHGEVHDPRAYRLGGVAGNAGLFGTADDLARFAAMMLGEGELQGVRVLEAAAVRTMTAGVDVPGARRTLGWDMRSPYAIQRAEAYSPVAYGHSGFTGVSLWIDPAQDLFVLLLANRVHPDGKGDVRMLAHDVGQLVATNVARMTPPRSAPVLLGIDVLRRDKFAPLDSARVGLITNVSGRARDGARTVDVLAQAPNLTLRAVFAPEHGLDGVLEGRLKNTTDAATGLPVYSLFGETRAPTPESLAGIDTLVFDIQDVGTRFYTYLSTMHAAMKVAAAHNLRFVVLDRPNPLGADRVEGPITDMRRASFVNHFPLPVRHGMTAGEIALLIRDAEKLPLNLQVIHLEGYARNATWDGTGLRWTAPSPNLPDPAAVTLYPMVGLLEATNLSVGRGTRTPFAVIGAPWMDAKAVAERLAERAPPGVVITTTNYRPTAAPYRGELCHGLAFRVTDDRAFLPVNTALSLAAALHAVHPAAWRVDDLQKLVAHGASFEAVRMGTPPADWASAWRDDLAGFLASRAAHLLY